MNLGPLCLHFDGKTINFAGSNIEFVIIAVSCSEKKQVIGLKGMIKDRSAATIFEGVKECITDFKIEDKIKIVITDTAAVNTGRINIEYFPCQLHVLDLSLIHI